MRLNRFLVVLLLAMLLVETGNSEAQETPCLAVITGLNGNVLIKKAGKAEFIKTLWGTQLYNGDLIKTFSGSEATLTFSNRNLVRLGPNSTLTVSADEPASAVTGSNVKKVSSAMMVNMSAFTPKKDNKKDAGALAGLRSVAIEEAIEPLSPYNTMIKTNRPDFTWMSDKPYDKFIVNLYNSRGLVWSRKVSESSMKFPEPEKGLEYGETYFWNVEGEDLLDNKKSPNHKFSVLSAEKTREVLDQENEIRSTFSTDNDSSSLHSFLGAYYMEQGLLQDAIGEFIIVSRMNPDAPLPHEILGSLYSDAGKKDKAIEELQKALSLSKNGKEK